LKVLVNDGMIPEGIQLFKNAGIEIDSNWRDQKALVEQIGLFDALIVRSATTVTREVIEAGVKGNLKIVGRAGVGTDNIDVEAATQNGIIVKTAPHGNTNATAELAFSLMLNISRNLPQSYYSLKHGMWKKKSFEGSELSGKTLGILGCGRVGRRLSELVIGFNMQIIGYDPVISNNSRIKFVPKDVVLANADFLSVHVTGDKQVIGERELSLMKPTAYIINTARGRSVDERALYKALKERRIAGAALDVYADEPGQEGSEFTNTLGQLDNVVLSSHLGASTVEAQRKTSIEMASAVIGYLLRGDFSNAVNVGESIECEQRPLYALFVYHVDKPGMFAKIGKVLADYDVNIRENPSRQIGAGYALAVYLVHQKVQQEVMEALNELEGVIRVTI
jgi:D-3-phosphoglycerate dehydrogenase